MKTSNKVKRNPAKPAAIECNRANVAKLKSWAKADAKASGGRYAELRKMYDGHKLSDVQADFSVLRAECRKANEAAPGTYVLGTISTYLSNIARVLAAGKALPVASSDLQRVASECPKLSTKGAKSKRSKETAKAVSKGGDVVALSQGAAAVLAPVVKAIGALPASQQVAACMAMRSAFEAWSKAQAASKPGKAAPSKPTNKPGKAGKASKPEATQHAPQ